MTYPLVADLADEGIAVALICRVLGFSKQAYFKWRARPCSDRDHADARLINAALDVHHDDPTFGYRFIADELKDQGFVTSENRVQRLCSLQGIWSLHAKKRGRIRRPGPRCTTTWSGVTSRPRWPTSCG
jgi:putative transposase